MKLITDTVFLHNFANLFPLSNFFSFDVSQYTRVLEFETEELLFSENEVPRYLYYLTEGTCKIYLTHPNGKKSLINFINAPCFIGEMELVGAQETSNSIKAITKCVCYAIEISPIKENLLSDSLFLRHLCHFLATKAIENTSNYSRNQVYTLENRLADYIIKTSNNGLYTEKHTEVSEFLGVTYRHFLYVLADFTKQGILKKTNSGYKILSPERLSELSCLN